MITTILTHPGGAHKDDLLAACVLVAEHGAPIVRRDPTQADLDDVHTAIIDVGGSHDPSLNNFDHHHFPREHPPTCALSLVLQHLGLYQDALAFCDWMEPAEWFDSRGPKRTAEWLGVPRRAINQLNSPVDGTLLRRFGHVSELASGDPIYEFMRIVGEDLVSFLRTARTRLDAVADRVERWSIPAGDETIEALFLRREDPLPDEPSGVLHDYIRDQKLANIVAAIVYPDRRGTGYGISRYEDHPQLDFCRVQAEDDVRFAHKSGFVCKTVAMEPERLKQLVQGAWIAKA